MAEKEKKKRKRDYGRIIAIAIVCIFFFVWIMDDYFDVDKFWNPQEGGVEYKLEVERQGNEDDIICIWAYWEPFDNTVRWRFWGDVLQEDKVLFDLEGIAVNGEFGMYDCKVLGTWILRHVLVHEVWIDREEDMETISIQIKNDVFTVDLSDVPYAPMERD